MSEDLPRMGLSARPSSSVVNNSYVCIHRRVRRLLRSGAFCGLEGIIEANVCVADGLEHRVSGQCTDIRDGSVPHGVVRLETVGEGDTTTLAQERLGIHRGRDLPSKLPAALGVFGLQFDNDVRVGNLLVSSASVRDDDGLVRPSIVTYLCGRIT